jgi:hypothetical protein
LVEADRASRIPDPDSFARSSRSGSPQIAEASLASPMWLRQSGRFAVISKSTTGSSPYSTLATSKPRREISRARVSTSALTGTSSRSQL